MSELTVNRAVNSIGVSGYTGKNLLVTLESITAPRPGDADMKFAAISGCSGKVDMFES